MITWKETPKPVRIIILIIIILLLIWFGANVWRLLRRPPNAHYISAGGDIPASWNKVQVTDDLWKAFSGPALTGKYDAIHEFNQLNDNQKIAVYNDWNDRYSTKSIFLGMGSYGTLTQTLSDEKFLFGTDAYDESRIMYENLKRLQLT